MLLFCVVVFQVYIQQKSMWKGLLAPVTAQLRKCIAILSRKDMPLILELCSYWNPILIKDWLLSPLFTSNSHSGNAPIVNIILILKMQSSFLKGFSNTKLIHKPFQHSNHIFWSSHLTDLAEEYFVYSERKSNCLYLWLQNAFPLALFP